ncbi:LuxR C-terminal-related transcriptional regulator [Streptomyces sp. NPDC051909]|uniref:LuxR C-terminal-related transcriptional regulator n=1 Tax=Streptomyces sp. NPDC051909 TaxID=3154944 RepID=UPI0034198DE2
MKARQLMKRNSPAGRWPLIGRDDEMRFFAYSLTDGSSRGFVICGPAGMGKTRLAEECIQEARNLERRVMTVRADETREASGVIHLTALLPLLQADGEAGAASISAPSPFASADELSPPVILIDDMHLLDPASVVLLRQMMDAGKVFIVGTIRSGAASGDRLEPIVSAESVRRLDLSGLNEAHVAELVENVLGGPVGIRSIHQLYDTCKGNVFYLRELLLGSLTNGAITYDGHLWDIASGALTGTPRLVDLIADRLAVAADTDLPVLEELAVCGVIALQDAERLCSAPALSAMESAGLITVTQDGRRTTVSLSHPVYGEVIRGQLSAERRKEILLAHVERVTRQGSRRSDDPLRLASWQLLATGSAEPQLLLQAAFLARTAHDYAHVVGLLSTVPAESHSMQSRLLLGESLSALGRSDEAESVFRDAQENGGGQSLSLLRARTVNLFNAGRPDEALAINEAAAQHALDQKWLQALRVNEGAVRALSGDPVAGLQLLNAMDSEAPPCAEYVDVWLFGLSIKAAALASTGKTLEACDLARHAYSIHVDMDQSTLHLHPTTQACPLVLALTEAGQLVQAREIGRKALTDSVRAGAAVPQMWITLFLARNESIAGRYRQAQRLYLEAVSLARWQKSRLPLILGESGYLMTSCILGDVDLADKALISGQESTVSMLGLHGHERVTGTAWREISQGNLKSARKILAEGAASARRAGQLNSESLLLTEISRIGWARDVYGRLREIADQTDGRLAEGRARFSAAMASGSPEALFTVSEYLENMGVHILAAEAANSAAKHWREEGDGRRAAAANQMMKRNIDQCEGALTPGTSDAERTGVLSSREREIAQLAAQGNSSQEIAAILTLSVRTVDNHLQRAYRKLGIGSRKGLVEALRRFHPGVLG